MLENPGRIQSGFAIGDFCFKGMSGSLGIVEWSYCPYSSQRHQCTVALRSGSPQVAERLKKTLWKVGIVTRSTPLAQKFFQPRGVPFVRNPPVTAHRTYKPPGL